MQVDLAGNNRKASETAPHLPQTSREVTLKGKLIRVSLLLEIHSQYLFKKDVVEYYQIQVSHRLRLLRSYLREEVLLKLDNIGLIREDQTKRPFSLEHIGRKLLRITKRANVKPLCNAVEKRRLGHLQAVE